MKRKIKWNKYQSQPTLQTRKWYFKHLIDPRFQGLNRLLVLWYENDAWSYKRCFHPTVKIKYLNVMADGKKFFDQPVKNDFITNKKIWKISTGQGEDYINCCLLDDSNRFKQKRST